MPTSFAQQRMWFFDQLEPGSDLYNIGAAVRLKGELDIEALEESLSAIVERHEALRSVFKEEGGEVVQELQRAEKVKVKVVKVRGSKQEEREEEAEKIAEQEVSRGFDLGRGPLMRVVVIEAGEQEHVLVVSMHHIVSDGWSMGILIREMGEIYEGKRRGREAKVEEMKVQYGEYAAWERERLQGEVIEEQIKYWREQLGGRLPEMELRTDHPRPAIQSYRGARRSVMLPSPLIAAIARLSQREGLTLFMTLLAAFKTLLHRYTGQEDIVVGTPVAGRNRVELEGLIGLFVNTLVLRTNLSGDPSFRETMSRVRKIALEAYAYQDLPFDKLVEELRPQRGMNYQPLFQVMFILQKAQTALEFEDLTMAPFMLEKKTSLYDLSLQIIEESEGFRAVLEYNSDLFVASGIERALSHYQTLLEGIIADPDCRIRDLPLMTQGEREQVLVEWNNTKSDYPRQICLHHLFEAQVERTPNRIALVYEQQQLSYRELNGRANKLARYLIAAGVRREGLVGISVERSIEMVVGLIGIMKAGAAYVALDGGYPAQRLSYMIEDAQLKILLTSQHMADKFSTSVASVVCLDSQWPLIAQESDENLDSRATDTNLAYVIYTSGSTGKPKGVMNTHAGICNRLLWMQDEYGLTEDDSVLQKTPFSFDVSVWEFFWPLITGARLVMAKPGGHLDSAYIVKKIVKEKITTIHFVPSMLQAFLEEQDVTTASYLKRVICSGEALPFQLQERFHSRMDAELHNLYGPTEAAVDVTYWACDEESERQVVPIGRPIANTRIYLLDKNMHPIPAGVAGELHIEGICLARGYYN